MYSSSPRRVFATTLALLVFLMSCGGTDVCTLSVTVTPSSATLEVGESVTFSAPSTNSKACGVVTTNWSTSAPSIAQVSGSGQVTAVGPGTAAITVTASGGGSSASATATVTVTEPPVATVDVTPATGSIEVGESLTLTAVMKDARGNTLTGRSVTWTTSSEGVASVSSGGVVTGGAPGSATITATSEGRSGTASITVTSAAVARVQVDPAASTIEVGQTTTLAARLFDARGAELTGREVAWSTDAAAVAIVTDGVVTGVGQGSATITATAEGVAGSASVTVAPASVSSVTVTPGTGTVAVGQTITLAARLEDAQGNVLTGRTVTWASGSETIATVSQSGVVTGVGVGSVTITATSEGKSGSATITVTQAAVASVTVSPASASVTVGQTVTLTAEVKDASGAVLTGRTVVWSSSNQAIATVSSDGVVTGVAQGQVTIQATSEGKSGAATVTVTAVPLDLMAVSPTSAQVSVGEEVTLTAAPLVHCSDEGSLCTFSGTRTIYYGANGIFVSQNHTDGVTCSNAVFGDPVPGVFKACYVLQTGRTLTWSSSNTAVATVTASGVVRGVSGGSATITVSAEGKSAPAAITVVQPRFAYTWANSATSSSYTPAASWSYNSSGQGISISRSGTGRYTVTFAGLGDNSGSVQSRETVLVTAYRETAVCGVQNWFDSGSDFSVNVYCNTPAGAPMDSRYTVLVVGAGSLEGTNGFVWTSSSLSAYTPSSSWAWNSADAAMRVTLEGQARRVDWGAVPSTATGVTYLMTPYGLGSHVCVPVQVDFGVSSQPIGCWDAAGTVVDERFTAFMAQGGRPGQRAAFGFVEQAGATTQTPRSVLRYNSSGGTVTVTRTGTGRYVFDFPGLAKGSSDTETVIVSPFGPSAACVVDSWGNSGSSLQVVARCFDRSGVAQDHMFFLMVVQ